ncbi:MAG TPA: aldehyde dehydrogenase family protein [Acidobacteriota bacterium]|nr:aldehyde dehydrogenase family protein [Acidobacteriota bacterium]
MTTPLTQIPANMQPPYIEQKTFVSNGKGQTWSGESTQVFSPIYIDGKPQLLGSQPMFDEAQSLQVLDAAVKAYAGGDGAWPKMPVVERIHYMNLFISNMTKKREQVVNSLMWEIAKPRKDSEKEFDRTIEYMKKTMESLEELSRSYSLQSHEGVMSRDGRSPFGVTFSVAPFNYPLNETYTTLIPALLMGNTVVLKPAKNGALLHEPLLDAYAQSFPPGVVNTLYGDGFKVIPPIMKSGKVDVLAFIGSNGASNAIQKMHPDPNKLTSILGLGAKNIGIVLPTSNLEEAASEVVAGSLSFNGQRCTALKQLFIHSAVYDEFMSLYVPKVQNLVKGMPWTPNVSITPLLDMNQVKRMDDYVKDALNKGAQLVCGGDWENTLYSPAVLANVDKSMLVYNEEQFGPVVPVTKFSRLAEPIEYATQSPLGQQASVFGYDPIAVSALVDGLKDKVSRINLNAQCQRGPDVYAFTGKKASAKGVLSIRDALLAFSLPNMVAAKDNARNRELYAELKKHSQFF